MSYDSGTISLEVRYHSQIGDSWVNHERTRSEGSLGALGCRSDLGTQEDTRKQSLIICFFLAQTMSLLPGLEVVARSTHPAEASSEEGSQEEAVPSMPQDGGLGVHQALNSTDLDVPTEAVTRESQGPGVWGGNMQGNFICYQQHRYAVFALGADVDRGVLGRPSCGFCEVSSSLPLCPVRSQAQGIQLRLLGKRHLCLSERELVCWAGPEAGTQFSALFRAGPGCKRKRETPSCSGEKGAKIHLLYQAWLEVSWPWIQARSCQDHFVISKCHLL